MNDVLIFLLILSYISLTLASPVVCTTRYGACTYTAAVCQLDARCRFEYGVGSAALAPSGWDLLLVNQTGLLSDDPGHSTARDVRRLSLPDVLVDIPLLAYTNESDPDALNCDGLALQVANWSLTNETEAALLVETQTPVMWTLLNILVLHQAYEGTEENCADLNQIPVRDLSGSSASVQYLCQPGKSCHMGNDYVDTAYEFIAIILVVIITACTIYMIATSAIALRNRYNEQKERRHEREERVAAQRRVY